MSYCLRQSIEEFNKIEKEKMSIFREFSGIIDLDDDTILKYIDSFYDKEEYIAIDEYDRLIELIHIDIYELKFKEKLIKTINFLRKLGNIEIQGNSLKGSVGEFIVSIDFDTNDISMISTFENVVSISKIQMIKDQTITSYKQITSVKEHFQDFISELEGTDGINKLNIDIYEEKHHFSGIREYKSNKKRTKKNYYCSNNSEFKILTEPNALENFIIGEENTRKNGYVLRKTYKEYFLPNTYNNPVCEPIRNKIEDQSAYYILEEQDGNDLVFNEDTKVEITSIEYDKLYSKVSKNKTLIKQ